MVTLLILLGHFFLVYSEEWPTSAHEAWLMIQLDSRKRVVPIIDHVSTGLVIQL